MQQPAFSIITITYNASRWLEQTILGVLSQSYPNIEYIVIDGGSTDGTVAVSYTHLTLPTTAYV